MDKDSEGYTRHHAVKARIGAQKSAKSLSIPKEEASKNYIA